MIEAKILNKAEKLHALSQDKSNENESSNALDKLHELLKRHNLTWTDFLEFSKQEYIITIDNEYEMELFRAILTKKHRDDKMEVNGTVHENQILLMINKSNFDIIDKLYTKLVVKYRSARYDVQSKIENSASHTTATGGYIYISLDSSSPRWNKEFNEGFFLTAFIAKYDLIPKDIEKPKEPSKLTPEEIRQMQEIFNMFHKENLYDQLDD